MVVRIAFSFLLLLAFAAAVAWTTDRYRPDGPRLAQLLQGSQTPTTAANSSGGPASSGPADTGERRARAGNPQAGGQQAGGQQGRPPAAQGRPPGGPRAGGPRGRPAPTVEVALARTEEVHMTVEAVGTTRARRSVEIASLSSGRVKEVRFDAGDLITRDQLLVLLEDTAEQAALRNAKATLEEAEKALERTTQLAERGSVSAATADQYLAAKLRAQALFDQAEHALDLKTIEAPFDGIIGFRQIEPGARIDSSTVIARLDDLSEIDLDFRMPEAFYGRVKPDLPGIARAAAFPGRTFEGEVSLIDQRIDEVSRSFQVRLAIPNRNYELPAGMFMTVELTLQSRDGVMVPEESVVAEAGESHVFVVVDDNVEKRQVEVGIRRDGLAEIVTGVAAGEALVARGVQKVRDGAQVRVLNEDILAPAGDGEPATAGDPPRGGQAPATTSEQQQRTDAEGRRLAEHREQSAAN